MITQEKITEILARYPEEKPTVLSYTKVREDITLLAVGALRAAQGAEGVFPCKPGDIIFFIDRVDCFECPHGDVCPGVTHGGRGASSPKPTDYVCPFEIVNCEVDELAYISDTDGIYLRVNDCYDFIEPHETIRFSFEEAEADLAALERGSER